MAVFSSLWTSIAIWMVVMSMQAHAQTEPTILEVTLDSTHPGERARLQFQVASDASVAGYDDVRLELYDASTGNLVRGKDICEPIAGPLFPNNTDQTCFIHNLKPNTEYMARIRAFIAANVNETTMNDGFTNFSTYFNFTTGSSLSLTCDTDSFTVEFLYDDVISHNPSVRISEAFMYSGNESTFHFDSQDGIQGIYTGVNTFIIDRDEVTLFRGYPSSIMIDSNDTIITNLKVMFSFHDSALIHGDNSSTYQLVTTDLSGHLITGVAGEVNADGQLTGLQFTILMDNGTVVDTDCIGPAPNCTTFNLTQTEDNEYLVTIMGEFDNTTKSFVALSFGWAALDISEYHLSGNSSCVLNQTIDWHDIEKSNFGIYVSPPSSCGSSRTIDDATKQINYTNGIDLGDNSSSSAPVAGVGLSIVRPQGGINLRCTYNTSGTVDSNFSVEGEAEQYAHGTNEIPYQMVFYADAGYTTPYALGTVLSVVMNDRFYFAAKFKDNNPDLLGGMVLYAPECYATKDMSPDKSNGYIMLQKDGCKMADDPVFQRDYGVRTMANNTIDPMSYTAFGWQGETAAIVYIHCMVVGCINISDPNCIAPTEASCGNGVSRRRRAVDELVEEPLKTITVSSQPLYFTASNNRLGSVNLVNPYGMSTRSAQLSFLFVTGMALLMAKFIYSWNKKNKLAAQTKYEVLPSVN